MESNTETHSDTEQFKHSTKVEKRQPESGRLLEAELVDLSYRQFLVPFVGAIFCVVLLAYVLYHPSLAAGYYYWFGSLLAVYSLRPLLVYRYRRSARQPTPKNLQFWKNTYLGLIFLAGIVWGLGAALLMPDDPQSQAFVIIVIGGLSAAAIVTNVHIKHAGIAFSLSALIPPSLYFLLQPGETNIAIGVLVVLFALLISTTSHYLHRLAYQSLENVRNNRTLVSKLQNTTRKILKLNQALQRENVERRYAEERFRRLSDASNEGILIHDKGVIVDANERMANLLGYKVTEIIGTHILSHVAEESKPDVRSRLANPDEQIHRINIQHRDGHCISVEQHGKEIPFGKLNLRVVVIHDLSERLASASALSEEKERALVTLESIGDGVVTTDFDGRINYVNPVTEELSGWNKQEAVGKYLNEIIRLHDQSTGEVITDPVSNCLVHERKISINGEIILRGTRSTKEYSIEVTISPIRNADDRIIGTVLVFHDVTVLHSMAKQMSHQATHDALTGLINRQEFEHRLSAVLDSIHRKNHQQHAMCYLDLDEFKVVNDTSGHAAGDTLLKDLTSRLESCIRETDTLARLGGDEFGVLLQNCPLDRAKEIAESMRRTVLEYRLGWEDHVHQVGVSIGLVPLDEDSGELTDILRSADSACYVAKDKGRNRVHVYEKDDIELARHHGNMRWMRRIQMALERDDFRIFYQPVRDTSLEISNVLHFEVLIRMLDKDGHITTPHNFIPAAERYHLMVDIDRWVIRHTFAKLKNMLEDSSYDSVLCSINLSGQSLSDDDFLVYLESYIRSTGIRPDSLCFEITETAAISNIDQVQYFINGLRDMGCKFALDDFGSGLSSFSYLKRLPIDFLKIDGSFIRNICVDKTDYAMVKSIQEIGNAIGVKTIAEFVESNEIIESLKELGVDYIQGYGIAMPAPLDDLLESNDDISGFFKTTI